MSFDFNGRTYRIPFEPFFVSISTFLLFCVQEIIRGAQPFGSVTSQINDLSVQFVPFASEFRRILLGTTNISSYAWTWAAGGGVPMHGNISTYDGGLLFPIVLLLTPESQIEFAFFLITGISYSLAAGFMYLFLTRLHPSLPLWLAGFLSVGYGMSSWAVQDGNYMQMWLSGHYMLPLLALVALNSSNFKGFSSGVLVVAITWLSNYYSAYMASIGAGLFIIFYLLIEKTTLKHSLKAIGFFALQGLLGVLISAVSWLPTFRQVLNGIEQEGQPALWPAFPAFLGHFLPWTQSLSVSPSFAVTSLTLFLLALVLFSSAIPLRTRVIIGASFFVLVLSFADPLTVMVWNVFDTPNGNLWRAAFVVAFFMTLMAGYIGSNLQKLQWTAWLGASCILLYIYYLTLTDSANRGHRSLYLLVSLVFAIAGLLSVVLAHRKPQYRRVVIGLFVGISAFELAVSNVWMITHRDATVFSPYPMWTTVAEQELKRRDEIVADMRYATEPVDLVKAEASNPSDANKGFLLSLPSTTYYSSVIPNASLVLADGLGITAGVSPRNQSDSIDPVAQALMGGTLRFHDEPETEKLLPVPFAHLLPATTPLKEPVFRGIDWHTHPKDNVFLARNELLNANVYVTPLESAVTSHPVKLKDGSFADGSRITGRCPSESTVVFDGRDYREELSVNDVPTELYHDIVPLARAQAADGTFEFDVSTDVQPDTFGLSLSDKIMCFNSSTYTESVTNLSDVESTSDRFGTVTMQSPNPLTGVIVLKMPVVEGYSCRTEHGEVPVSSLHGLAAFPVEDVQAVTCTYTIPWQKLASLISFIALLTSVLLAWRINKLQDSEG